MSRYDADYVMMMVRQRHKELSKEAEQSRLLKAARPPATRQPPVLKFRAVACWLAEWSSRLQCLARGSVASIIGGC